MVLIRPNNRAIGTMAHVLRKQQWRIGSEIKSMNRDECGGGGGPPAGSLDSSARGLTFELDLAESGFVLAHILLQHVEQGLGLRRAQEDALKILNGHAV